MPIVTGCVLVAPSDAAAFVANTAAFAKATRARDGCLFFAIAPGGIEEGRMLVIERWRERAAVDGHLAAGYTTAFVERWRMRMTGDVAEFDAANKPALLDP